MQVNDKLDRLFDVIRDRMSPEAIATFVGLFNTYGAFMHTEELLDFLRIKESTLSNMYRDGTVPFPVVKRGQQFIAATANVAAFLHKNDQRG